MKNSHNNKNFLKQLFRYSGATISYMLVMYALMIAFISCCAYIYPEVLIDILIQVILIGIFVFYIIVDMWLAVFNKLSIGNYIFNYIFGADIHFMVQLYDEFYNIIRAYDHV